MFPEPIFILLFLAVLAALLWVAAVCIPRIMLQTPFPTGPTGTIGLIGTKGLRGAKGDMGVTGPFSVIAPTGPTGEVNNNPGPKGPTGPPDENPLTPGPTGEPGPTGTVGMNALASQLSGPIFVPSGPWPVFDLLGLPVGDWRAPLDYYEEFTIPITVFSTLPVVVPPYSFPTVLTFVRLGNRVTMGILPVLFNSQSLDIGTLYFDTGILSSLARFWTSDAIGELIPVMYGPINAIGVGRLDIAANGASMTIGVGQSGTNHFMNNVQVGLQYAVYVSWNKF